MLEEGSCLLLLLELPREDSYLDSCLLLLLELPRGDSGLTSSVLKPREDELDPALDSCLLPLLDDEPFAHSGRTVSVRKPRAVLLELEVLSALRYS